MEREKKKTNVIVDPDSVHGHLHNLGKVKSTTWTGELSLSISELLNVRAQSMHTASL